ncbi:endonuclease NucS domain-containing protein [Myroides sp. WP-1]|uniref:endonuclease NucS domain-containing protein n=1 Tax=Myroides sp. WP-1 TaxID=2759944 RepID=UPI0015F837B2|nr:endonuclease NucS domain-containing protein [Myroides sp. WP-1]MBB1140646.1 DUF91 domain-containing protein [Myroides sp. WP-1]
MALFEYKANSFEIISPSSFKEININEKNLQQLIKTQIDVLGEDLLIISEEYSDWQESKKRLDLLAIDRDGNLVVIELKRDNDGFHMDLQAIRYAAMLSMMTYENAIIAFEKYLSNNSEDSSKARYFISEFLTLNNEDNIEFGKDIRIILVNTNFSKELTSSVLWLRNKGLDIKCIQIQPYLNSNNQYFIDIDILLPLKESNDYMIAIEKKEKEKDLVKNQINSTRDYSTYKFKNNMFRKGRLVLEVIKQYILDNPSITIEHLKNIFPDNLQGSIGVIRTLEEYKNGNLKGKRYFDGADEVIELSDKTKIVVSTQWGIGNINNLLEKAKELGYDIQLNN